MLGDARRATRSPLRHGAALALALTLSIAATAIAQENTPNIEGSGTYLPGDYTFYCATYRDPPDAPMLGVGRAPNEGERGRLVNVTVGIERLEGERARRVVTVRDLENEVCRANLVEPGIYEVSSETNISSWIWVKNPDASSVNVTRVVRQPLPLKFFRSVYRIQIGDAEIAPPPEPDCANPSLEIEHPRPDTLVAFDRGAPGRLEIQLEAIVLPDDCPAEVQWQADDIRGSTKTFLSADGTQSNQGQTLTLVYEGLPERTDAFGPKTITATVGGVSKQVAVQVFFDPDATNHAGEGHNQTPNWFHYWLQTSAGQDRTLSEVKYDDPCQREDGVSHFDGMQNPNAMDVIFVCDDARIHQQFEITGQRTWGIDTYAVVIIHEWTHKRNFDEWWRELITEMARDPEIWKDGKWDVDRFLAATVGSVDSDQDAIPNHFEPGIPASRGGPLDSTKIDTYGYDTTDDEYLAFKAQEAWPIGFADDEDWSRCGKQWRQKYPNDCPEIPPPKKN